MTVTVAICTWNRAALLDRTLSEMRKLRTPDGLRWELLVVNNNCTDDTDAVIRRHSGRLPLRRLFEREQGHSHARNRALREARGELLVWTDDDVLVEPGWLAEYTRAAREHPEAGFFAGPIEPWYEVEPPAWFRRHLGQLTGVVVLADQGPEARPYRLGDQVFGANMAFRTAVAKAFPADARLGRVGGLLTGGDDTDLVVRAFRAGHTGYCLPGARLRHFVPAERVSEGYVWRWFRGSGHTLVRQTGDPGGARIWGVPRWALRRYVGARCRSALHRLSRNESWFEAFVDAARMEGVIREAFALRGAGRAPQLPTGC
jgi:glycosyltransferase involved in cell wall biosynthesis